MSLTDSSFDTADTDEHTAESTNNEQVVRCCKLKEANKVISSLQSRATTQIDAGNLSKALQYLNRSLALQQKLHGKTHPEVASTLNKIGELLSNMKGTNGEDYRYMALSALEESLAIRQSLNESGSEETAVTLKNMWCLLHDTNVAISGEEESITFEDMN